MENQKRKPGYAHKRRKVAILGGYGYNDTVFLSEYRRQPVFLHYKHIPMEGA